jgi:predicted CoA-binding protein
MITKAAIDGVLSQEVLAVAGASNNPNKFGHIAYKELKAKGYRVLPVNPNAPTIDSDPCYPSLQALPEKVGGLVVITQPEVTEKLVHEAASLGIKNIWMQQGSESSAAVQFCQENGINVVSGECIMMYQAHPAFPHNLHKFIKFALGGKPR